MPPAGNGLWVEISPDGLCKYVLDAVLVERGALQVADGLDLAGEGGALVMGDGRHVLLLQLPLSVGVAAEVAFCADQEDRNAGTMVRHLMMITNFSKCVYKDCEQIKIISNI